MTGAGSLSTSARMALKISISKNAAVRSACLRILLYLLIVSLCMATVSTSSFPLLDAATAAGALGPPKLPGYAALLPPVAAPATALGKLLGTPGPIVEFSFTVEGLGLFRSSFGFGMTNQSRLTSAIGTGMYFLASIGTIVSSSFSDTSGISMTEMRDAENGIANAHVLAVTLHSRITSLSA